MNKIRTTIHCGTDKPCPWPSRDPYADPIGYTITLRYQGRQFTTPFWTSNSAHLSVFGTCVLLYPPGSAHAWPSTSDVVNCLISDCSMLASYGDNPPSFEEWAADYGYDSESRSAEKTYRDVIAQGERVRRLLGDDYEVICAMDEDEIERVIA